MTFASAATSGFSPAKARSAQVFLHSCGNAYNAQDWRAQGKAAYFIVKDGKPALASTLGTGSLCNFLAAHLRQQSETEEKALKA